MAAGDSLKTDDPLETDSLYAGDLTDDPYNFLFDEDKAKKAAAATKLFQDVSVGSSITKGKAAAEQERETIGKGAAESRASAEQQDFFKRKDEERDYGQAQRAYRY